MKRPVLLMALMLFGATHASATDIAGKWGIGATLFNSGVETSLIRGHSNRTAWVFDVSLSGGTSDRTEEATGQPTVEVNTKAWGVAVGPALRRFFRPESDFSPYGDLFVSFAYAHQHDDGGTNASTVTTSTPSVATGLAFGLEYFTRWHCSIAADTDVFRVGWSRFSQDFEPAGGGFTGSTTDDRIQASVGLFPRLILRAYF